MNVGKILSGKNKKSIAIAICLIMMIGLLSLPALRSGVYDGHDLVFHLGRIKEIATGIQNGQFPVRYEDDAWYGYGYITSTMYPSFFMYIPAFLYLLGIPLFRAYNIYVIMINILTVCLGYFSFKKIFKSENWGLLADIIYCFSAYRFANLYRRSAVGEYTAMSFIPLLIYGIYKLYFESEQKESIFKRVLPIVLAMFGIIESHILTTEMLAIFVLLFGLLNIKKTLGLYKEIILSVALILFSNAFFLIPFLDTYIHEDLVIANTAWETDGEGLYISQFFKPFAEGRGSDLSWSPDHEEFLALGIAIVICVMFTLAALVWHKRITSSASQKKYMPAVLQLFLLGILAGWFSTIYFPWAHLTGDGMFAKLMCAVQFPWRYLLIMTICFLITGVYSAKAIYEYIICSKLENTFVSKHYYKGLLLVFVAIAFMQSGVFYLYLMYGSETIRDESPIDGWPDYVDALYLIEGTDKHVIRDELDVIDNGDSVTLPIFGYNHVTLLDENGESVTWEKGYNNRITIDKNDYSEGMTTRFDYPMAWNIGGWISIITILVYSICIFRIKKEQGK